MFFLSEKPIGYENPSFVSKCCVFVSFLELAVRTFLKFRFKEVTSLYLTCFYNVMLPKYYLVLIVIGFALIMLQICSD
jgi:hypothetical protein